MIDTIVRIAGSLLVGGIGLVIFAFAVIFIMVLFDEATKHYKGTK